MIADVWQIQSVGDIILGICDECQVLWILIGGALSL